MRTNEYDLDALYSVISDETSLTDLAQLIGDFGLVITDIEEPETTCPAAA